MFDPGECEFCEEEICLDCYTTIYFEDEEE